MPTNQIQVQILFKYYARNMRTIDFFLNTCVFPTAQMRFPQRLMASAWDPEICQQQLLFSNDVFFPMRGFASQLASTNQSIITSEPCPPKSRLAGK